MLVVMLQCSVHIKTHRLVGCAVGSEVVRPGVTSLTGTAGGIELPPLVLVTCDCSGLSSVPTVILAWPATAGIPP